MTKKDYIAISLALRDCQTDHDNSPETTRVFEAIFKSLADVLARDNPRFDRERFIDACWNIKDRTE